MTSAPLRPGGPSAIHEYRTATLSTMATLAGYSTTMGGLPDGTRPDVLQLRPDGRGVFVGDAKATETPGNLETFARLDHYAAFLAGWVASGGCGVLALAVPEVDAYGWLSRLRDLCLRASGGLRVEGRVDRLEVHTVVVWHAFAGGFAHVAGTR